MSDRYVASVPVASWSKLSLYGSESVLVPGEAARPLPWPVVVVTL